jgi:hypothetical protein
MYETILRHFPDLPKIDPIDRLEDLVRDELAGQIEEFHLMLLDGGLVLTGHAHDSYARHLAEAAVIEATDLPLVANEILVAPASARAKARHGGERSGHGPRMVRGRSPAPW